jgi:hypothetical protein
MGLGAGGASEGLEGLLGAVWGRGPDHEGACRGLYRAGAHVVLACRNKGSAEKAMESIKASVVRADTPPPVADDKPQPRPTHLRFVGVC